MPTALPKLDAILNRGRNVASALGRIDGLRMFDEYRGEFRRGNARAQLVLAPGQWLKLTMCVAAAPSPCEALAINPSLPGNLRFAVQGEHLLLRADVRLDREAELSGAFDAMGRGLNFALRHCSHTVGHEAADGGPASRSAEAAVQAVVDRLPWNADAAVRHETGWELRPKVRGRAVPVRLELSGARLRLRAMLASMFPDAPCEAACRQALRENGRLRAARLARLGDELAAEACLDAGALRPEGLADAALAVAVAKTATTAVLETLIHDADLARWYTMLLPVAWPAGMTQESLANRGP